MINLLNPDGTLQRERRAVRGPRSPSQVRKRVVEDLEAQGLARQGRAHANRVGILRPQQDADRAVPVGPVVRPRMDDLLAQDAMDAVRSGRGPRSTPSGTPRATSTGSARSATGASAGSSGGVTGFRSGVKLIQLGVKPIRLSTKCQRLAG